MHGAANSSRRHLAPGVATVQPCSPPRHVFGFGEPRCVHTEPGARPGCASCAKMALRYRLKHALRAIFSGTAAAAAQSPVEAARSSQHAYALRASESANANLKACNWPSEASFKSSLPSRARWTPSSSSCAKQQQQQQYHSTSLLQEGGRQPGAAAAESSAEKWDIGNPPVDESATERGSSDRGRDAPGGGDIDRGLASRSSHTLRAGHTPEAQVDVAYTPNLDRPINTGEVVRTNLRRSEERQRRQERDSPHPLRGDDPDAADDSRTREGTSPDAAAASAAATKSSSSSSFDNNNNMHMVAADEDKQLLWCMGVKVAVLCPGARTAGAYSTLEYTVAPGEGSSTHTHQREDETWYMLDGTLRWQLEDRTVDAQRGSFIHLPRGLPHSFANVSDKPARMLVSCVPAGFEDYFLEIGVPVDPEDAMTKPVASKEELERATDAGTRYGISYEAASGGRGGQTTASS